VLASQRWLLRLPKTVHHQHMPYSRDLYQEPDDPVLPELLEEDVQLTANEIERRKAEELMRQVGSTIRWRWTKDAEGRPVKQPNARIVKWSDGSLSLQLGKPTNMFSLVSHPDPSYPAAPQSYLVNHHWDAELMQTEGMYAGHMTLVPVGMEGEAHRILAKGVKERNREKSRMKMWDDDSMTASNVDIPGVKKARAKAVRGPREDNGGGSSRKKAVRSAAAAAGRGRRGSIYSDDSESELDDEEERRRRRRLSAGGGKAGASARDADDGGGYANDGFVVRPLARSPSRSGLVPTRADHPCHPTGLGRRRGGGLARAITVVQGQVEAAGVADAILVRGGGRGARVGGGLVRGGRPVAQAIQGRQGEAPRARGLDRERRDGQRGRRRRARRGRDQEAPRRHRRRGRGRVTCSWIPRDALMPFPVRLQTTQVTWTRAP